MSWLGGNRNASASWEGVEPRQISLFAVLSLVRNYKEKRCMGKEKVGNCLSRS